MVHKKQPFSVPATKQLHSSEMTIFRTELLVNVTKTLNSLNMGGGGGWGGGGACKIRGMGTLTIGEFIIVGLIELQNN